MPKGQVKLVADPGVTVTPVPRAGVAWTARRAGQPCRAASDISPSRPPSACRSPARTAGRSRPTVEYAYCLVDYQCLFGEAKVSAPTQAPQG